MLIVLYQIDARTLENLSPVTKAWFVMLGIVPVPFPEYYGA